MSRLSIARRIDRVREHFRPRGSLQWKLDQLSDVDRATWDSWAVQADRIISRFSSEPGRAFELLADGEIHLPPIPRHVERALWPEWSNSPDDPQQAYDELRREG